MHGVPADTRVDASAYSFEQHHRARHKYAELETNYTLIKTIIFANSLLAFQNRFQPFFPKQINYVY